MTITLTIKPSPADISRIFRIKQDIFRSLSGAEERKDKLAIAKLKDQLKRFDESTRKFFE